MNIELQSDEQGSSPEIQSGSETGPGRWPSPHGGPAWGCPPPICRCHRRNTAGGQSILGPEVQRKLLPALADPEIRVITVSYTEHVIQGVSLGTHLLLVSTCDLNETEKCIAFEF